MDFYQIFLTLGCTVLFYLNFVCGTFFHPHRGLGPGHRVFHEMMRTPCPPSEWDYRAGPVHVRGPIPHLARRHIRPKHVKIIPRKIIHRKPKIFDAQRLLVFRRRKLPRKTIAPLQRKKVFFRRVNKGPATAYRKRILKYPKWSLPLLPRNNAGLDTTYIKRFINRQNEQTWHELNLWILKNQNGGFGVGPVDGRFPNAAFIPNPRRRAPQNPKIPNKKILTRDKDRSIPIVGKDIPKQIGKKSPLLIPIFFNRMRTPRPMPILPNIDIGAPTSGPPNIPTFAANMDPTTPPTDWQRNNINGILSFDPAVVPPAEANGLPKIPELSAFEISPSDPLLQTINFDTFRNQNQSFSTTTTPNPIIPRIPPVIPVDIPPLPHDDPNAGRVDSLDIFPFPDLSFGPQISGIPLPPTSNKAKDSIIAKPLEPFGPGKPVARQNKTFLSKDAWVEIPEPVTRNPNGGNLDIVIPDSLIAELHGGGISDNNLGSNLGSENSTTPSPGGEGMNDVFFPVPISNFGIKGSDSSPSLFPPDIDFRSVFIPTPVAFSEKSGDISMRDPVSPSDVMQNVFIPVPLIPMSTTTVPSTTVTLTSSTVPVLDNVKPDITTPTTSATTVSELRPATTTTTKKTTTVLTTTTIPSTKLTTPTTTEPVTTTMTTPAITTTVTVTLPTTKSTTVQEQTTASSTTPFTTYSTTQTAPQTTTTSTTTEITTTPTTTPASTTTSSSVTTVTPTTPTTTVTQPPTTTSTTTASPTTPLTTPITTETTTLRTTTPLATTTTTTVPTTTTTSPTSTSTTQTTPTTTTSTTTTTPTTTYEPTTTQTTIPSTTVTSTTPELRATSTTPMTTTTTTTTSRVTTTPLETTMTTTTSTPTTMTTTMPSSTSTVTIPTATTAAVMSVAPTSSTEATSITSFTPEISTTSTNVTSDGNTTTTEIMPEESCHTKGCYEGEECVHGEFWLCPDYIPEIPCSCRTGCKVGRIFIPFGDTMVMDACGSTCSCYSIYGIPECKRETCRIQKTKLTTFVPTRITTSTTTEPPSTTDKSYIIQNQPPQTGSRGISHGGIIRIPLRKRNKSSKGKVSLDKNMKSRLRNG